MNKGDTWSTLNSVCVFFFINGETMSTIWIHKLLCFFLKQYQFI